MSNTEPCTVCKVGVDGVEVHGGYIGQELLCTPCLVKRLKKAEAEDKEVEDLKWVITTLEESIKARGGSVTYHDGGMSQSPSKKQRKPHIWFDNLHILEHEQDLAQQLLKVASVYCRLINSREKRGFEIPISETVRTGMAISKKELLFRLLDKAVKTYAREVFDCSPEEIIKQAEDEEK